MLHVSKPLDLRAATDTCFNPNKQRPPRQVFHPAEDDDHSDREDDKLSWQDDAEHSTSTNMSTSIITCTNATSTTPIGNDNNNSVTGWSGNSDENFYYQKQTPTTRLDYTMASALSQLFKHCSNANIPRQQIPLVERELPRNLKVCVDWEHYQNMFPAGSRLATPFSCRPVDEGENSLLGW